MKALAIALMIGLGAVQAAAAAKPASPPVPAADPAQEKLLAEGLALIRAKQPQQAIERFDAINAFYEKRHRNTSQRIYCARSTTELLIYMGMAAKDGQSAIGLGSTWSDAIFFKGFALIDLDRPAEAAPLIARALELAPMNSQYLAEAAEMKKSARDWPGAYAMFERAASAAQLAVDDDRALALGRAWRGMGFALIEMSRLDEAEAMFKKALGLDPNDANAQHELRYIGQLRAKTPAT